MNQIIHLPQIFFLTLYNEDFIILGTSNYNPVSYKYYNMKKLIYISLLFCSYTTFSQDNYLITYHKYVKFDFLDNIEKSDKQTDDQFDQMKKEMLSKAEDRYDIIYIYSKEDTVFTINGPTMYDGKEVNINSKNSFMSYIVPSSKEVVLLNLERNYGCKRQFEEYDEWSLLKDTIEIDGYLCKQAEKLVGNQKYQVAYRAIGNLRFITPYYINGVQDVVFKYEDNIGIFYLKSIKKMSNFKVPEFDQVKKFVTFNEYRNLNRTNVGR